MPIFDLTCNPNELLPTSTQLRAGMEPYLDGSPVGLDLGRQAAFRLWELRENTDDWEYVDRLITHTLEQPTNDPVGVRAHCFYTALSMWGEKDAYFRWITAQYEACITFAYDHALWSLYGVALQSRRDQLADKHAAGDLSHEDYHGELTQLETLGESALQVAEQHNSEIYHTLFDLHLDLHHNTETLTSLCRRWQAAAQTPDELYDAYFHPFSSITSDACWAHAHIGIAALERALDQGSPDRHWSIALGLLDFHREVVEKYESSGPLPHNLVDLCISHFDRAIAVLRQYIDPAQHNNLISTVGCAYKERGDFCRRHKRMKEAERSYIAGIDYWDFALNQAGLPVSRDNSGHILDLRRSVAAIQ